MRTELNTLVAAVSNLVDAEIALITEEDTYGCIDGVSVEDSFGGIRLTAYCEPEDAIWTRDLQDNYYHGLRLGVRNAVKVLLDNPKLITEYLANANH